MFSQKSVSELRQKEYKASIGRYEKTSFIEDIEEATNYRYKKMGYGETLVGRLFGFDKPIYSVRLRHISTDELLKKLRLHEKWIMGEHGGCMADLRLTDLSGHNNILEGRVLRGADLRLSCLDHVSLAGADLRGADLRGASMRVTSIEGAFIDLSDIRYADILGVDLSSSASSRLVRTCPRQRLFLSAMYGSYLRCLARGFVPLSVPRNKNTRGPFRNASDIF